jgi:hypothetical protein
MNSTTLTAFATSDEPTARPQRRALRSIGAVLAGFLVIAIASTATDALMRALGIFPSGTTDPMSDGLFLLAAAYRAVYGIFGTYLAARLAPSKPFQHALVLGAIGVVLGTLGAIAMWSFGGHWYAIANIAMPLPAALIGGKLARFRSRA